MSVYATNRGSLAPFMACMRPAALAIGLAAGIEAKGFILCERTRARPGPCLHADTRPMLTVSLPLTHETLSVTCMSDPSNVFHITVRAWPLCSLISDYARLCHNKLANSLRLQYWANSPFWAYCYIWDAAVHIWTNSAAFTRALARSQRPRANVPLDLNSFFRVAPALIAVVASS